jgi:hypothetical protein
MPRDGETMTSSDNDMDHAEIRVAIFGSCVSRDTCEFVRSAAVETYVARQSAIVSLNPAGEGTFSSEGLSSQFQAKMFEGDQRGDAVRRLLAADPDVILIDLVDERRGVWKFPNGSYLTNSVEATRAGVEDWAPARGARLIEFGSDEHFELWSVAFTRQMRELDRGNLLFRTLLLEIEWAAAVEGHPYPRSGLRSMLGRQVRRGQRRARTGLRQLQQGGSIAQSLLAAQGIEETRAESFRRRAERANRLSERYFQRAHEFVASRIFRPSWELRINPDHKWGPEPFHYRDEDYVSIGNEIIDLYTTMRR